MAVAKIYPEPAKLKRAGSSGSEHPNVSKSKISEARTVLSFASEASYSEAAEAEGR